MYSDKNLFASLNNGRNAGNADKMDISGVALWRLALKWLCLFEKCWIRGGYNDTCPICFYFYASSSERLLQYNRNCLLRILCRLLFSDNHWSTGQ